MIDIGSLPTSEVDEFVYRVILSRYPQIHLFERVANAADWEVLYAVESMTNPRLRDEVGDIRLVAAEDRVYGDGASWIMAAFTHPPVDGRGPKGAREREAPPVARECARRSYSAIGSKRSTTMSRGKSNSRSSPRRGDTSRLPPSQS